MSHKSENKKTLLMRYQSLMEEAYNIRYTDPAMSDYDFFEGIKLRRLLEIKYRLKFTIKTQDLLK